MLALDRDAMAEAAAARARAYLQLTLGDDRVHFVDSEAGLERCRNPNPYPDPNLNVNANPTDPNPKPNPKPNPNPNPNPDLMCSSGCTTLALKPAMFFVNRQSHNHSAWRLQAHRASCVLLCICQPCRRQC